MLCTHTSQTCFENNKEKGKTTNKHLGLSAVHHLAHNKKVERRVKLWCDGNYRERFNTLSSGLKKRSKNIIVRLLFFLDVGNLIINQKSMLVHDRTTWFLLFSGGPKSSCVRLLSKQSSNSSSPPPKRLPWMAAYLKWKCQTQTSTGIRDQSARTPGAMHARSCRQDTEQK